MLVSLYKLLTKIIYFIGFPLFYVFSSCTGYQRKSLAERQGIYHFPLAARRPRVWFHGASVGEIQVIRAILPQVQQLLPQANFIVSTMTEQGYALAKTQLATQAHYCYAPLDAPGPVNRALTYLKPDIYVAVETELWPNLLFTAHAKGIKLLLVNGRLSARSTHRYQHIQGLIRPLLQQFKAISTISAQDKARYEKLCPERTDITITGNSKYDLQPPGERQQLGQYYRHRLGLTTNQPLFVLGSTHGNEEEQFLQELPRLRNQLPDLVTVIAPRHLQRLPELSVLCQKRAIPFRLYSTMDGKKSCPLIILDTMGELAALYSAATYIFCGGSLVKKGGHNIFEGAIMGKPIFYGPYMDDFIDACALLEPGGGSIQVNNWPECVTEIIQLANDPTRYQKMAEANRRIALLHQGAAQRQAELIIKALAVNSSQPPDATNI